MLRGKCFLLLGVAILCSVAGPARAAMFDFHFGSLSSAFSLDSATTGTFSANDYSQTIGSVTDMTSSNVAAFLWALGTPYTGGSFDLSMNVAAISPTLMTATGTGYFIITDTDTVGDTIRGTLDGDWSRVGVSNVFSGVLTDVMFKDNGTSDGQFNGHAGSLLTISDSGPWVGTLMELSTTGTWFSEGDYTSNSGSVDASVVPIPTAVLLGFLGLGVAGLKLRKLV